MDSNILKNTKVDSQTVVNFNPAGIHISFSVEKLESKHITLARKYRKSQKFTENLWTIISHSTLKFLLFLQKKTSH